MLFHRERMPYGFYCHRKWGIMAGHIASFTSCRCLFLPPYRVDNSDFPRITAPQRPNIINSWPSLLRLFYTRGGRLYSFPTASGMTNVLLDSVFGVTPQILATLPEIPTLRSPQASVPFLPTHEYTGY